MKTATLMALTLFAFGLIALCWGNGGPPHLGDLIAGVVGGVGVGLVFVAGYLTSPHRRRP